jgi:hypothetical protein
MRTLARSIIVALIALVATGAAVPAMAQGNQTFTQRWYFASDFGQWAVRGQQANTYQWSPGTVCNVSAVGSSTSFFAFNTNAPVLISDITGPTTNNEVVTPSSVTQTNAYCTIAVSPSHNHYSFQVQSGTGGLQEALNAISPTAVVPAVVWLDRNWYSLANAVPSTTPAAIITAAAGGVSAILVDNTTAPFTNYVWQGTAYASGTWVNTAPTAATGAATTGTVFTETWATSNQFVYSPVCTVISTGATAPPTLTVTPTYAGGTHALLTVTVAAALTSTTAYSFQWACH